MDLEKIRELIMLMKDNQLQEIALKSEGEEIKLVAAGPAPHIHVSSPGPHPTHGMAGTPHGLESHPGVPVAPGTAPAAAGALESAPEEAEEEGVLITSPIVGVFYRTPSPDKPPFVEVGDQIDDHSVLCIIEAMKVMNEIKAETAGTVRRILVEHGQPVEYGQPLFVIDPAG